MSVLRRVGDALVRSVLASPAHGLLSDRVAVLTYTGRRSGRRFALPVQYVQRDEQLVLWPAHPERKRWLRNFDPPAPVSVRLRGHDRRGSARLLRGGRDSDAVAAALAAFVRRFPAARRALEHDALDLAGPVSAATAGRAAGRVVIVLVDLEEQPGGTGGAQR